MDKKGRAAGTGQGGGDLIPNMTRFTHADYNDSPLTMEKIATRQGELIAQSGKE
jgi:hypothetical protein